ncbi:MAG: substrate-binding domain-containing protein [Anaerolineaceae bacterium]|nr:substrate-binding domain-containing protein [Anaerolineaceae bacterium]
MIESLDNGKAAEPKYIQVANIIRQNILDGTWREGDAIPPEKILCSHFNIARGTMRQALQILETEGYLVREQGRGTFIKLVDQRTNNGNNRHLAFVVPYIRDSSVSTILIGFQQVAEQSGFSVIFNHVNNDLQQQQDVVQKLVQQGVMGIALYPVDSESLTGIDKLVNASFPIVLVDRYLKHFSTDYVISDHFGGALRGVHYLINQGHTRVGFVTWLSPAVSMDHRLLGYHQAMRERGLQIDENLICRVEGYPTVNRAPLENYLASENRPTAVFAANDQIAIAIYRAAATVGLRIPQDLSVMGFDDLDMSIHLDPPLTTLAQQFTTLGRQAAQVLLSRIKGEVRPLQQITVSPELIIRESCTHLLQHDIATSSKEWSVS